MSEISKICVVYIQDFEGYLITICGAFTNEEKAQEYIKDNYDQVEYFAGTTAKFFKTKFLYLI